MDDGIWIWNIFIFQRMIYFWNFNWWNQKFKLFWLMASKMVGWWDGSKKSVWWMHRHIGRTFRLETGTTLLNFWFLRRRYCLTITWNVYSIFEKWKWINVLEEKCFESILKNYKYVSKNLEQIRMMSQFGFSNFGM